MNALDMKAKTFRISRVITAAVVTLGLSWWLLKPAAELSAVLIRRQWPEAWFSGLIVWYARFFAVAISIAMALGIGRYTFKRQDT